MASPNRTLSQLPINSVPVNMDSSFRVRDLNATELEAEFRQIGLAPRLEIKDQFVFWKPDDADYWTKSSPK
jgi:hypothetical protein